jgi:LuxR family maltose regulon positive regulatory protein
MLFSNYLADEIQVPLRKAVDEDPNGLIEGEIMAAEALIQSYLGDQDLGEQLLLKALVKITHENLFFRQMIERNLGMVYMIKGELHKAAKWYESLLLSSHKLQDQNGILAAYNYLTTIRKVQGRFNDAEVIYNKALEYIQENHLHEFVHSIKIFAGYGHLLTQRHEIEEAKKYLRKAIFLAKQEDIVLTQKAYQDLSEIFIREHDLRSALANIQECRQHIQQRNCKYLQLFNQLLLATEARIHLEAGRIDQAYSWLTTSGFEEISPSDLYAKFGTQLGYILPIAASIYIRKNQDNKAIEILTASIPKFLHAGANAYLIRALNAAAVTYHKMGEKQKAIRALAKAIDLAKPENNLGDFIFIGRNLMPLLYEILQSGIETEFSGKLLAVFSTVSDAYTSAAHMMNTIDPLSRRELDVLHLIAKGMTNQEIAGTLYLSANTIKSHSIKIYRKLNVCNRTQAVSKARLLGILPAKYPSQYPTSA